ncbi:MAG: hypothetical protein WC980_02945 [Candidatus Brocadiia bacterium]
MVDYSWQVISAKGGSASGMMLPFERHKGAMALRRHKLPGDS